jgi:transposase, IS5 family
MHQTKKGNQWHFGMKAHIGVDADSGLVHTVTTAAANEADVEQVSDLLHGKENAVWADSGYRGAQRRMQQDVQWHIAGRPSDMAEMPEGRAKARARKQAFQKASIRAKLEHPVRVIKRQFGLAKGRFKRLAQEHGACGQAVCAVEPVDGQKETDCDDGAGVPAGSVNGP